MFLALDATVDELCRDRPELQRHGNVRNARPGVTLTAGAHIVVGNEEADPAVAEVVRIALSSRS